MNKTINQYFMSPNELVESLALSKPIELLKSFVSPSPVKIDSSNKKLLFGVLALVTVIYYGIEAYQEYEKRLSKK